MSENKTKFGLWTLIFKFGGKAITFLLKFSKIGLAGATFASYTALYSWKFAVMLMIAVGFHETGHVWAMKKMGIKTKGFYFLPFMGGVAIAEDRYKTYGQNAFVSIMGPIWGTALAYVCGAVYLITGNPFWAAATAWMATINLFNLLPIQPLDGGQMLKAISFSISKKWGLRILTAVLFLSGIVLFNLNMGLFVFFIIIGVIELWVEHRRRDRVLKQEYIKKHIDTILPGYSDSFESFEKSVEYPKDMNKNQLILSCISYAGTVVILILLLKLTNHIPGADLAHNFFE